MIINLVKRISIPQNFVSILSFVILTSSCDQLFHVVTLLMLCSKLLVLVCERVIFICCTSLDQTLKTN
jgi:hypothetical protein